MAARMVKETFPQLEDELYSYVESVLDSGEHFESADDVYDAVGAIIEQVAGEERHNEIRELCSRVAESLNVSNGSSVKTGAQSAAKLLDAPVHIGGRCSEKDSDEVEFDSIWLAQKEVTSRVDAKKLERAEEKIKKKQGKQSSVAAAPVTASLSSERVASASQVISKRDARAEARGANMSADIHLENFDISIGDKVLIDSADLTLVQGRRYGLVGRNGVGKTTLLRMIHSGDLAIPSHISVLHVEQEVHGDATLALQSVLSCDTRLETLLAEQRRLEAAVELSGDDDGVADQLAAVYSQLQAIDADSMPARAAVILRGLGFTPDMQRRPTSSFSGGWRMRLALARALFSRPDLLLLDEPTNMLDMKAIIWLEDYLQNWPTTLLVVSHDRKFLETVPTDILLLRARKIDVYRGNYDNFVKQKEEKLKNQQREYDAQVAFRAHVQEFIDRFRYNANRAALVQSKLKMLEKLPVLQPVEKETDVVLRLPATEALNPPILQLDEVGFKYPNSDRYVFRNVNLSAIMESRICIVGENGAGKTTLLKVFMDDLAPSTGTRRANKNLKIGYFSQHHVDQVDMDVNSIQLLARRFPGRPLEEYRQQLGSFGVTGDLATQLVASLSGGQKSRLAFAAMCMARPNFFVLDEPTNHLDIESIEALGEAINRFNGGCILVSHDERLIRMVCRELWVCADQTVRSLEGGFDEYREIVRRELESTS